MDGNVLDDSAACPPNCTCIGTEIRCSNQSFSVPEEIPMATTESYKTELYMDDIAVMPYEMKPTDNALYLCQRGKCM